MAWIESHQSLARHRKTLRAVALLGINRLQFLGHLHTLWWWALDNADRNGCLGDVIAGEIAEAAEWDGDAQTFVAALVEAGFLEQTAVAYVLHGWYDHAGKLFDQRERNANRMRSARAVQAQADMRRLARLTNEDSSGQVSVTSQTPDAHVSDTLPITKEAADAHVSSTSQARVRHVSDTCRATGPDLTGPDLTGPDQEDSREIGTAAAEGGSGGETAMAAAALTPEVAGKLDALNRVLVGCNGYMPTQEFAGKVGRTYGDLDLEEEALKMLDWLRRRGSKRVCSHAFVLTWLRKAAAQGPPPPPRVPPALGDGATAAEPKGYWGLREYARRLHMAQQPSKEAAGDA